MSEALGTPPAWLAFLGAYAISNRLLAIPIGIGLGIPVWAVGVGTFVFDLFQIALYDWIYHHGGRMWRAARGLHETEEKISHAHWLARFGHAGVAVLAALPTFGGGIWTAVLLARHFHLRDGPKVGWIAVGSLIGILAVLLPALGILHVVKG